MPEEELESHYSSDISSDGRSSGGFQSHDTAELAMLARMHMAQEPRLGFKEAVAEVMWGLDVAQRCPAGSEERPPVMKWGAIGRAICGVMVLSLILLLLLLLNRANFKAYSVSDGVLLARGTPSYRGQEPVAATATWREMRHLSGIAGLPANTLRNIREVELEHSGAWRSIRVERVAKYSDAHAWLEAPDGTAVRVQAGQVYLRMGALGDEMKVNPASNAKAYFGVTVSTLGGPGSDSSAL
jgi:hypothetical protein